MNPLRPIRPCVAWLSLLALSSDAIAQQDAFDPCIAVRGAVSEIERRHLSRKPIDDQQSRNWLRAFLEKLDPQRMYFWQQDVEEFRRSEDRLDDLAKEGDFAFPELVRMRYQQRVKEAVSCAEEFLSIQHDYSLDEELPIRFQAYPATREEARQRWRLRIKHELLIEKAHGRPLAEVQSQLLSRYRRIARDARQMSDERLCQIYLDSLASVYDPHSAYLSDAFVSQFERGVVTPRTYSLGLHLRQRAGQWVIASLPPLTTDATRGSELLGWRLLAIRRLEGSTLDIVEMHLDDVSDLIRSPLGPLASDTEVILEVMNPVTYERRTLKWPRFVARPTSW